MPVYEVSDMQIPPTSRKRYNTAKRLNRREAHSPRSHRTSNSIGDAVTIVNETESITSTFEQFCATCEQQIPLSEPSILYCSDKCRTQDSNAQSLPLFKTDISPPPSPHRSSLDEGPFRDIIPQRSPTSRDMVEHSFFPVYGEQLHSSLLDNSASCSLRPIPHRSESEAARFLAQFRSPDSSERWHSRSSSITSNEPAPSLSLTPMSATSASSPYIPYEATAASRRIQPPRTNPRWSSTSFSARSVDLVTPVSYASSAQTIVNGSVTDQNYVTMTGVQESTAGSVDLLGKCVSHPRTTRPETSGLKQMFRGDPRQASAAADNEHS